MMWSYSRRHTKVCLLATLVLFTAYGLLVGQLWQQSNSPHRNIASTVGVFAGVQDNEVNRYMTELDARARALDVRESTLAQSVLTQDSTVLKYITVGGLGLLGLILMNFYLDHKRRMSLV